MRTTMILAATALSFLAMGCSDDKDENAFNARSAKISSEIDRLADDVSAIAEARYVAQSEGRIPDAQAFLPECATITTTISGQTWTSTVDFGTAGCTLENGNVVTGKIILSGSTDFGSDTYVLQYVLDDFHHNGCEVAGTRTVTFSWQGTAAQPEAHTVADIDLDFTVTYPNGNVYHRTGQRVRELVSGYDTPFNWLDNVYQVSGQWTTTFPNATALQTSIATPLVYYVTCPHIGKGILQFSSGSNTATLDYGDGTCDHFATLVINGGSPSTILLD